MCVREKKPRKTVGNCGWKRKHYVSHDVLRRHFRLRGPAPRSVCEWGRLKVAESEVGVGDGAESRAEPQRDSARTWSCFPPGFINSVSPLRSCWVTRSAFTDFTLSLSATRSFSVIAELTLSSRRLYCVCFPPSAPGCARVHTALLRTRVEENKTRLILSSSGFSLGGRWRISALSCELVGLREFLFNRRSTPRLRQAPGLQVSHLTLGSRYSRDTSAVWPAMTSQGGFPSVEAGDDVPLKHHLISSHGSQQRRSL